MALRRGTAGMARADDVAWQGMAWQGSAVQGGQHKGGSAGEGEERGHHHFWNCVSPKESGLFCKILLLLYYVLIAYWEKRERGLCSLGP